MKFEKDFFIGKIIPWPLAVFSKLDVFCKEILHRVHKKSYVIMITFTTYLLDRSESSSQVDGGVPNNKVRGLNKEKEKGERDGKSFLSSVELVVCIHAYV
jgi:hypothetical protein